MARLSTDPQSSKRPPLRISLPLGWFWPLFWSGLMIGSGVIGLWAMRWLTQIPPLPDCEQATALRSASDRLLCAEASLQAGNAQDLITAIQLTADWPATSPLYAEARPILIEASQRLLSKATQQMHRGHLTQAIDWASQIPLETPLRQEAQAAIWNWQQEWQRGQALATTIQQAIAARNWAQADQGLQQLKQLSSDYWLSQRHEALQQAKQREQKAWAQVNQARALAQTGNPEQLGAALMLAQQVDLTSQAWQAAQADINRWSQNLLLYSFQRWELGDIEGAIAAVQKVPPDPDLAPEAQDLIQISHAQRLADQATQSSPRYINLFQLMEAIQAVRQIGPSSTFYETAQQSLRTWQQQLEDLQRLQFARSITRLRQPWAYTYAAQLAWTVTPDRPLRISAQTLIAHWENEIERIEDRPYLYRARRLAQAGTLPALRAAIAQAQKIDLGRALRLEAQTAIAAWSNQIEMIQDQPILDRASDLAEADQLPAAIAQAQQIQADRALYDEAQALIQDWTRTLQIREDGPILAEAKDLAFTGYLTQAIAVAAQIAPGRALYDEAQRAIRLWEAERAYVLQQRAEAEAREADEAATRDASETRPPDADPSPPPSSPPTRPIDR